MKKSSTSRWFDLAGELKRRGVYPTIAAYAVVGWVVLQIGEVTFEPLRLPEWAMPTLILAVVLGFPVVVILAWFFEFSFKGIRLDAAYSKGENDAEPRTSIAVLPFADMSPERDQSYFCEGVAEEILNALAKLSELQVVARSSSFQHKDPGVDVRKVGRMLGVGSILEGSVRKSDHHLRVSAQLVDVANGYHIWSKSFDRDLADIFQIQDEIALSIVESLLESITPGQASELKTQRCRDASAYDFCLRGWHFLNRFHKADIGFARQMFERAIEVDPGYALAWAGYADCYSLLVMYAEQGSGYRDQALMASAKALELDPNLAEGHASRGLALLISNDYELADKAFKQALKLDPRTYQAYYYYGRSRFHQGDLEMAANLFQSAAEVNPDEYQSRCLRVQILIGTGRVAEAAAEAREAVAILERHLDRYPDDIRALHLGAGSLIACGDIQRARQWLQRALERDPHDSVLLYNVACSFAKMGEIDASLGYLEAAVDNGMVNAAWVKNDTDLEALHQHPRYLALLARLQSAGT